MRPLVALAVLVGSLAGCETPSTSSPPAAWPPLESHRTVRAVPTSFRAVVTLGGFSSFGGRSARLRPEPHEVPMEPTQLVFVSRATGEGFRAIVTRQEDDEDLLIDPVPADAHLAVLTNGETVTVTPIGSIPGIDDTAPPRRGASDVVPRSR
jgi:hypothetical protein